MGLINSLNSGLSGILANQKQVEITGNNIANVNAPGYSRQSAQMAPKGAVKVQGHLFGQGVDLQEVSRAYDRFVSGQITDQSNVLGQESVKSGPLAELERIFGLGEDSLTSDIERFFGAWHDLSQNPGGYVERDRVLYEGNNLLDAFAQTADEMVTISQNIDETLSSKSSGINLKLQRIAELNDSIKSKEGLGHVANQDRDERDLLVNELSKSLGVQTYQAGEGQIGVQLPGGIPLVQGNEAVAFDSYYQSGKLHFQITSGMVSLQANRENFGGEFKGLLDVRDDLIPALEQDVADLKYSLITEVNAQHEKGYDLDGQTGQSFFTGIDQSSVQLTSTQEVAAAGATQGAPGDNENALAIYDLMNARVDGEKTFVDSYARISSTVGTESRRNSMARDGAADTMTQLENMRESLIGVSLEQEMINLTLFQKGFEASSRFVSTVDEMLTTVLNLKR